jgi:dienelactone hydrolase
VRILRCLVLLSALALPATTQEVAERLEGHLIEYVPERQGAFPGIVAIPGCSGISLNSPTTDRGGGSPTDPYFRRHYPKMAETLREQGYAVFLLDYQSAEGVVSACLGEVAPSRIAEYVVASVRRAAADPRVENERLFVIGWSLGGAGLLNAIELLDGEDTPTAAAIAVYPGCDGAAPWSHHLPVHLFLGDADDITSAETCRSLAESLDPSLPVSVTSYPDARHGFDIADAPPSISTGRGTTIGYNQAAAEKAWRRIREILSGG